MEKTDEMKEFDKKLTEELKKSPLYIKTGQPEKAPDEKSGISAEGHLRIFDPETDEEFLNGRDD